MIGGGIIGTAAAAILADRGARVTLVEAEAIGAGASGRNLGALQHPFDPILAGMHHDSLTRYRALAGNGAFALPEAPAGLLLLNHDLAAVRRKASILADTLPELEPAVLDPDEVIAAEPSLRPGPAAIRLETGYPIPPASATAAWAELARERRVAIRLGQGATPVVEGGTAVGVELADGTSMAADVVLVAAGPWTPELADPSGVWRPIVRTWGVTVQLDLRGDAPRHIIEEDEVESINRAEAATARAARHDDDDEPPSLFSLASADGVTTLGSTFLPDPPDLDRIVPLLIGRAARWMTGIDPGRLIATRICARPQSVDGRPFIGPLPGVANLHVCAGHGPWGISTGPGSAAIAARAILDGTPPPAELLASRAV